MAQQPLRVLVIEDVPDDAELLLRHLRGVYEPTYERVETAEELRAALDRQDWDIILCDYSLPQFSALAALAIIQDRRLDLPFIVVSGAIGEERAAHTIKAGAHAFVSKDNLLTALLPAMASELLSSRYRAPLRRLERENAALVAAMHAEVDQSLKTIVRMLEFKDLESEEHSRRVTRLTVRLARLMGIKNGELEQVERGAFLHDIGKVGIPDAILKKPDILTPEERAIMERHPVYAYELLVSHSHLRGPAIDIPYGHHEKWDGSGYPRGLKGEEIPRAARIFAVIDVFDALTSKRPYRKPWTEKRALREIRAKAGTSFDPVIVKTFATHLLSGDLRY